jgi:hypothetical protein
LGYLDDLLLVPLGIWLVLRLIPAEVMAESRSKAEEMLAVDHPRNWLAGGIIIAIWLLLAALAIVLVLQLIRG